jgi:glucose-1-phosphate cytidylyltransferase
VKVVLFCGGQGLRMREYAENVPKPMAPIGPRPVLWHVMRYYAHFGHQDFVLCLGYGAQSIKRYFLDYDETVSNDFLLSNGGRTVELASRDIQDWRVFFAHTGVNALVGQRLRAVRSQAVGDGMFLASYGDCLTDAPLNEFIEDFRSRDAVAAFLSVRPSYTFHVVESDARGAVTSIQHVRDTGIRINGGYFILRDEIFDYIERGEDLVQEPFRRLVNDGRLLAYRYDGFWMPMDTLKEMRELEQLYQTGRPPWAIWQQANGQARQP